MAGASFTIELRADDVRQAFARLARFEGNRLPLFAEIGSILEDSARKRFQAEQSPEGIPWKPINPAWRQEKGERGLNTGILKMRGDLLNSVRADPPNNDGVSIIASLPYAAAHQFGAEIRPKKGKALRVGGRFVGKVTIPARPFLGISAEDAEEILDATEDYLDSVMVGRSIP